MTQMNNPFSQARWIWSADPGDPHFAIRRFRGKFETTERQTVACHISADSRYLLYIDGRLMGRGPSRSDVRHYQYDTYGVDLMPGRHSVAVLVLAYHGATAPVAEMHDQGALVVAVHSEPGKVLCATGANDQWRVQNDTAYRAVPNKIAATAYFAIGSVEDVDGNALPHGWEEIDFNDSAWDAPVAIRDAYLRERPSDLADGGGRWRLIPRDIPHLREEPRLFVEHAQFPLTVAANSRYEVILNAGEYADGYPILKIEGGAGAEIETAYAEALTKKGVKGIRDDREGTDVIGFSDIYRPSGRSETYSPLHWRAFRFIKLVIRTGNAPLTVTECSYLMTGYPWNRQAAFSVAQEPAELQEVMDVDFRTLERCTGETFMDCPYYEQLQYVGDTRLQALLGYVTTGDTRLGARAVRLFDWSRSPDGLTQSRYPSAIEQVIPPFSLFWILMVEDLWRYSPQEAKTVRDSLAGCRSVLEWFGKHLNADGLLSGQIPWWNFVDWLDEWHEGVPPVVREGLPSAILNLQFLAAQQAAARLYAGLGDAREAELWRGKATELAAAISRAFWNADKRLLRDGPDDAWGFSQHAQAWGLLTDVVPALAVDSVVESLHTDDTLAKTTFYHTFYVVEALAHVGRLEHLWDKWLAPWRDALSLHLSTWPEKPEPTRSDCHAWSAWPTYALLTHVLGLKPTKPGFAEHEIAPRRVNGWDKVSGQVPTPAGLLDVSVQWHSDGTSQVQTSVTAPK